MTDEEAADELAAEWLEAVERGETVSPAQVCRDRPELIPEVTRRADALRRVQALMPPAESVANETSLETVAQAPAAFAPPPELPPGYEVLKKLDEGGMGVVYLARNITLKRVEAVKIIRAGEAAGPKALARFKFEAEAAAGLRHPNIVQVYTVGEGPTGPFIAMQYVDGKNLEKNPPTDPRGIATVLAKVARAVDYAHRQGILHRDLKPANVLVDESGEPYVADFGIARRLDADPTLTQAGIPIGTPAYMSPEQARGEAILTEAADVYSLGVVLFELLTGGHRPFGGSVLEVLQKVQAEAPPEPRRFDPGVDTDLEAVCLKCLEKDPADRYRTAGELADDLERYLRGEAVTAHPPGFFDWVRQVAKTRPEPHPHYSWEVTTWFGGLVLAASVAVYLLTRFGGAAGWVWVANGGCAAAMTAVLWWYMVRRFRELPVTERHSLVIAAGKVVVYLALTAAYVPFSFSAPATPALAMYPALAVCSGLGLFTLGSTNWSRFFPLGLASILAAPLLAFWPDVSPLVYGASIAAVMWFWAYAKGVWFGVREG